MKSEFSDFGAYPRVSVFGSIAFLLQMGWHFHTPYGLVLLLLILSLFLLGTFSLLFLRPLDVMVWRGLRISEPRGCLASLFVKSSGSSDNVRYKLALNIMCIVVRSWIYIALVAEMALLY